MGPFYWHSLDNIKHLLCDRHLYHKKTPCGTLSQAKTILTKVLVQQDFF